MNGEHSNPPRHPATDTCDDSCPTWLHSRATCCHFHNPTPQHPAAPETETDANRLTEAELEALDEPWCRADGPALIAAVERIVAERVRVVEGERDAEVAEAEREHEKTLAIMEAACDRSDAATLRAESAEAAHEAERAAHERLRAGVEALAADFDTAVGFRGAATSLRALLGGGGDR